MLPFYLVSPHLTKRLIEGQSSTYWSAGNIIEVLSCFPLRFFLLRTIFLIVPIPLQKMIWSTCLSMCFWMIPLSILALSYVWCIINWPVCLCTSLRTTFIRVPKSKFYDPFNQSILLLSQRAVPVFVFLIGYSTFLITGHVICWSCIFCNTTIGSIPYVFYEGIHLLIVDNFHIFVYIVICRNPAYIRFRCKIPTNLRSGALMTELTGFR